MRSLLRQEGIKPERKSTTTFSQSMRELGLPEPLGSDIAPILELVDTLNEKIRRADQEIAKLAADQVPQRLISVPGVGPVTAVAFVSAIDRPGRFRSAKQVRAYLGLVPREHSSGERSSRGRITKQGGTRMRYLLVQAAWAILRSHPKPKSEPLRRWTAAVAARRGKYIAVVALARRLAGILFALWRDGTSFVVPAEVGGKEAAA